MVISNISTVHIKRKGRIALNSTTKINHITNIDKIVQNPSPQYILNLLCELQALINDAIYFTEKNIAVQKL